MYKYYIEKKNDFSKFYEWVDNNQYLRCFESNFEYNLPNYKNWIIIGTGGSMLGPKAFASVKNSTNVKFLQSIDPITVKKTLDSIDFESTGCLVISKSGKTVETLMHFLKVPKDNTFVMSELNFHENWIPFEKDIGGRFWMFSNVGKVVANILGFDFSNFCNGAKKAIADSKSELFLNNVVAMSKKDIYVIWTYGDRLEEFSKWCVQLFGESLGKNGKGFMPISSKGPDDQHSLLQLYLDGPKNKYFNMLHLNESFEFEQDNYKTEFEDINKLQDKKFSEIMKYAFDATTETLINHSIPLKSLSLNVFDEYTLGYLMMNAVLEVVAIATILNVNPFDQNAVEEVKIKMKEKIIVN